MTTKAKTNARRSAAQLNAKPANQKTPASSKAGLELINPSLARMNLAAKMVKTRDTGELTALAAAYAALNGVPPVDRNTRLEIAGIVNRTEYGGEAPKTLPPPLEVAGFCTAKSEATDSGALVSEPPVDSELRYLDAQVERAHLRLDKLSAAIEPVLAPEPSQPATPASGPSVGSPRPPYGPLATALENQNFRLFRLIERIESLAGRVQLSTKN